MKKFLPKRKLTQTLFLGFVFLILGTISSYGQGPGSPTLINPDSLRFEIDGDLEPTGTAYSDWLQGSSGGSYIFETNGSRHDDYLFSVLRKDAYATKDDIALSGQLNDDPEDWSLKDGTNGKTDINNVMLHYSKDADGNQWIIVSGDRLSTTGDSYIDFEFLQDSLILTETGFISNGPDGGRRVNDFIISVSFLQGGGNPTIDVLLWKAKDGGGFAYDSITVPAGSYFATYNNGEVPVSIGAFGKSTYSQFQFVEAAVNVTAIRESNAIGGTAIQGSINPCDGTGLSVKTILVKTSTSHSPTSQLGDVVSPIYLDLNIGKATFSYEGPWCNSLSDSFEPNLDGTWDEGTISYGCNNPDLSINTTTGAITPSGSAAGTYTVYMYYEVNGCERVAETEVTIKEISEETIQVNGCDSVVVNGTPYYTSGIYTQVLTNAAECDSTLTIEATVTYSSEETIQVSGCDSVVVNGTPYYTSGIYTQVLTNAAECDSTLTIEATVLQSTSSIQEVTECDSYTWNGTTYTQSGTYTFETENAAECDSIATLVLTILESGEQTMNVTRCSSYTLNGTTYTESGTYTIITENTNGCTLTITLNLTILEPIELTDEASDLTVECDGMGNTEEFENWLNNIGTTGAAEVGFGNITWSNNYEGFISGCGSTGETTVTFTAMDECGNTVTTTATFRIVDTTAPDITCNDITVQLDSTGVATITVDDINGGASDNCGGLDTIYIDKEHFYCGGLGENEVTLTAIDECGNVSTCTATVTVVAGEYDCGVVPFKANPDILTLIYCPGGTVSGDIDLFANDEGFTSQNVSFNILTDLPEGVSITDGDLLYVNEDANEAVLTLTYSVCHTVNTENCDTSEVTIQVLLDTDCDGIPDIDDIDDDDDGILDVDEELFALNQTTLDSDGDGIVDRLDIDSDNDGIPDNIEWQQNIAEGAEAARRGGTDNGYDYYPPLGVDSDGDGWDDQYDTDNEGVYYAPLDMDQDGTPDYLDTDADGDGIEDWIEGWDASPHDTIADVTIGTTDSDGDGLWDPYDSYDTSGEWLHGRNAIGSYAPLQDMAGDTVNNIRDWRDVYEPIIIEEPQAEGCELLIPNGFSPNNDGYNDYFEIEMDCAEGEMTFEEAYPDAN